MGFLDAKAAAGKTQARRKPVDSVSVAPVARHAREPLKRAYGAPTNPAALSASMRRGKPQADRAAVVVKVRDQATIRTKPPGFEIGLELREAVAQWPEDLRDLWEERSAILEYDAGLPRPIAERRAYQIVSDANEAALLMAEAGQ